MAESTIERLYKLTVDATEAVRQLEKMARSTAAIDDKLSEFGRTAVKIGAAVGTAFAGKAFVDKILAASEAMDQLSKDTQKVGIAAEDLQRLRYAADLSGVSAEKLDKSMTNLAVGMQTVAEGTDETSKALRAVGVAAGDTTTQALEKIADQFAKMPDGAKKTAEAVALFGKKVGPDMIPLLNGGADALRELSAEADRFGGVISQDVLSQAEAFNDNLSRLQRVSTGAVTQLTAGLTPALVAITNAFVEASTQGGGFKTFGEGLGEVLKFVAKGAIYAAEAFRVAGTDIAALFAVAAHPTDFRVIFTAWQEDLKRIDDETVKLIATVDAQATAQTKSNKVTEEATDKTTKHAEAVAKLTEAQQHAADMMKVYSAAAQANQQIDEQAEKAAADRALTERALTDALHPAELAYRDVTAAADAYQASQEKQAAWEQALTELRDNGTESQKAWADAQLVSTAAQQSNVTTTIKQAEELTILEQGFDQAFQTLASGSADAADAFKRAVQSIIAELLKLWAKKFIIEAVSALFGGAKTPVAGAPSTGIQAAFGAAFAGGQILPFARGGILSAPMLAPLALMGEAGPEAVLPLRRGADGNLGVNAAGGGALKVAIHNYADASVSARRDGNGDLQIVIEQTKKAIAADFRRGGNDLARSAEGAWGLTRGAAAAF